MNRLPQLLQDLAATPDADGNVLLSFEKGEFHLVFHVESGLHRIVSDDFDDVVERARRFLADVRGESLDSAAGDVAPVLDFSAHRQRKRRVRPSAPWGGGDAA